MKEERIATEQKLVDILETTFRSVESVAGDAELA
jgi:hypothetical protein